MKHTEDNSDYKGSTIPKRVPQNTGGNYKYSTINRLIYDQI